MDLYLELKVNGETIYDMIMDIIHETNELRIHRRSCNKDQLLPESKDKIIINEVYCKIKILDKDSLFSSHLEIDPYPFFDDKERIQFLARLSNLTGSSIISWSKTSGIDMIKIMPDSSYQLVEVLFENDDGYNIQEIRNKFYFYFKEELDVSLFIKLLSEEITTHKIHFVELDHEWSQLIESIIDLTYFPDQCKEAKLRSIIRLISSIDLTKNQIEMAQIIAKSNNLICYFRNEYLGPKFLVEVSPNNPLRILDEELIPIDFDVFNESNLLNKILQCKIFV